jgi:hypothetical protein
MRLSPSGRLRAAVVAVQTLPEEPPHQASLDDLDEQQIGDGDADEEEVVCERQRRETERGCQWRDGQDSANDDDGECRDGQRTTRAAAQRIAQRADDEEHECLRRQRFYEPTRVKELL